MHPSIWISYFPYILSPSNLFAIHSPSLFFPLDTLDDPELDVTIFVPNNAGFLAFLKQADVTPEEFLAYPGLPDFLKYHIHGEAETISEFSEGDVFDTLQGDDIFVQFRKDGDPKYAGCGGSHLHLSTFVASPSDPVTCDIEACKSIIHIVDSPMVPKDESIEEAFPNIEIRSSNGVEEGDEHDHEDGEDHEGEDHDDDKEKEEVAAAAGSTSAAPSYMKHSVVAVVLMAAALMF